jgi:hypothetical protein
MLISFVLGMQILIESALRRYQSRGHGREQSDDGIGNTFVSVFCCAATAETALIRKYRRYHRLIARPIAFWLNE